MRVTDGYKQLKDILKISKNLGIKENVMFRVLDEKTGRVISEHTGHNSATNSLITGIGHYLVGEGVYNQGYEMLHRYVPLYISLGTMGLLNQEQDEEGLPAGIGVMPDINDVDDTDASQIYWTWRHLKEKLDLLKSGKQHIDKYGDPTKDEEGNPELQTDLHITVDDDPDNVYSYQAYIYPTKDTDEEKRAILEEYGYQPKIEYCVYYVNMVDSGEVDAEGNMILVPETYYTGELDPYGQKIYAPKWRIAKGIDGLIKILNDLRQCPYAESVKVRIYDGDIQVVKGRNVDSYTAAEYAEKYNKDKEYTDSIKTIEGQCLLHQKCLDCVFPDKKELIDKLQAILDAWQAEYDRVYEKYIKALDDLEGLKFDKYLDQCPGYGADGSCENGSADNNYRPYFGLGPEFRNRENSQRLTIDCELISPTFPREQISYREIVPETESELRNTVDVVFSVMISTGALKQFREPGKDYVFITEAGLWSDPEWNDSGENGLLAGYRIVPPNSENWVMSASKVKPEDIPEGSTAEEVAARNRKILKQNILKVGINQVVQVVWKIQIGGVDQFENMRDMFTVKNYQYSERLWFGNVPTSLPYIPYKDPVIEGIADTVIVQGSEFDPMAGVSGYKYVDGEKVETEVTVTPTELDTSTMGKYLFTYNIDKFKKSRYVTVKRLGYPIISGATDMEVKVNTEFDPLEGVTAVDANGDPVEVEVEE